MIETDKVRVRYCEERDCELITSYLQDEDVLGNLEAPPMPFKYTDALNFYQKMIKTYEGNRPEMFVVADKETDALMGCVSLHPEHTFDTRPDVAELGYWMGKPFWRKGYMKEAARVLIEKGFAEMGWQELVAQTNTDNVASQTLLKRLGFSYVGVRTRPKPPSRGTPNDACWVLTLDDYKEMVETDA